MQRMRGPWTHPRGDVAEARREAALRVGKQFRCGRCDEEVAPSAMWCPHCGFDMTSGGANEKKTRVDLQREPHFHTAGRRLLQGATAALIVLLVYLLLSLHSGTAGLVFGVIAFDLAMLTFAADLSVRSLLLSAPTMATSLVFLSVK